MTPKESETPRVSITPEYLAGFSKEQLLDLLSNRTRLYMIAMKSHVSDKLYVATLEKEIRIIHSAIRGSDSN